MTIAAQAALLVLGLDVDEYREVGAIIVYPTAMQSRGVRAGPVPGTVTDGVVPVVGEAHDRRGPVLLAWDEALEAARHPGRGHNLVLHEFAHKLDMLDNALDGTPPLGRRGDLERWVEVCTEAYEALRAGVERPPLQPYGATNPAEFFAVATERSSMFRFRCCGMNRSCTGCCAISTTRIPAARGSPRGLTPAPPSTTSTSPVIHDDASEIKNSAPEAMSSGTPRRPRRGSAPSPPRSAPTARAPCRSSRAAGAIALTRTLGASSCASCRVRWISAAFDTLYAPMNGPGAQSADGHDVQHDATVLVHVLVPRGTREPQRRGDVGVEDLGDRRPDRRP